MFVRVKSGAVLGVDGYMVDVEVDISNGLPVFDIVGLPDSAVKESRERVRAAIRNTGLNFPVKRITVNLAPADTRKSGPAFDLPVAVGLLIGMEALPVEAQDYFFAGELSLDGAVRPVSGILPMLLAARAAGVSEFFIPEGNAAEAALVDGIKIFPVENLEALLAHFSTQLDKKVYINHATKIPAPNSPTYNEDFADVSGQIYVKRALEVAAAGYHNILLIGPPGAGKTMMARRMPTILPALTPDESLEITKIYSIAGLLNDRGTLVQSRPFRTPHHTASYVAMVGGGRIPTPGEVSLAHNGVLFLDELPEFQKKTLETLRQPLEDGNITVSRAGSTVTYPCSFLLLAAMNPCPCGYRGTQKCTCTENEVAKYISKISGPLLDRIDIQIEVTAVTYDDLTVSTAAEESSQAIQARVETARARQTARFKPTSKISASKIHFNAKMTSAQIKKHAKITPEAETLLKQAFDNLNLSARAYHKIIKIARTIADLADSAEITPEHIAEAISYRSLDRKYW